MTRLVRAISKPQLVVAQMKNVALVDALVVDAHALVVDAIRRPEVLDVEGPVAPNHRRVLARDVAVFDREVGGLAAAADDELIFRHWVALTIVDEEQRRSRRAHLRHWPGRRRDRLWMLLLSRHVTGRSPTTTG